MVSAMHTMRSVRFFLKTLTIVSTSVSTPTAIIITKIANNVPNPSNPLFAVLCASSVAGITAATQVAKSVCLNLLCI